MKIEFNRIRGLLVCCILLLTIQAKTQVVWSLPIYVEDAVGNRDTVSWSIAEDASSWWGNDTIYGEIPITHAWDSVLEVRLSKHNDYMTRDTPTYKHIADSAAGFGTPYFLGGARILRIHAKHLPITISWDSTLIGPPSLSNLMIDHTMWTWLTHDLDWWPNLGEGADPPYYCMMNRSSIEQDFTYHRFRDSVDGDGTGGPFPFLGFRDILNNGDTAMIRGLILMVWPAYASTWCIDSFVSVEDVLTPSILDARVLQSTLIEHEITVREEFRPKAYYWTIHDLSGRRYRQGVHHAHASLVEPMDKTLSGTYVFSLITSDGMKYQEKFVKVE